MTPVVRAAGGVLWRPAGTSVEVALVHRPRYDDWSLPKGKLEPGEHVVVGALREVCEETGYEAVPGRTLGWSGYRVLLGGREVPKTVRWWALRATGGVFVPGREVDELAWLAPDAAARRLSAGRDLEPLRQLGAAPAPTTTVLLVRHGRAGSRADWPGHDELRPLDDKGQRQADALADLLLAYGVARVLTAPALRCRATMGPLLSRTGLAVRADQAFSEQVHAQAPELAVQRVRALSVLAGATVVCGHGGGIPDLVGRFAAEAGLAVGRPTARKGSVWALSFAGGRLVDADHVPDVLVP